MNSLRKQVCSLGVFLSLCFLATPRLAEAQHGTRRRVANADRPEIRNIFWQPNDVKQGSPVLISVELNGSAREVKGTWLGKPLRFFRTDKPAVWMALAGADAEQKPGNFDLKVSAAVRGRVVRGVKQIEVQETQFGQADVSVAQDYVNPTPDEQRQIAHDDSLKKRAFASLTPRRLWHGDFEKPIDAQFTPSFGESRLMNEEKSSIHLGTDYPAKEGTPVFASNSGVVVLAAPLFYEGNCVIVDHGDRLFTVYMHLSKIKVHKGERLRKHAEVGLSGRTGRVTGPHLHFEVVWSENHLDPLQLLALTVPEHEARATRHRAR